MMESRPSRLRAIAFLSGCLAGVLAGSASGAEESCGTCHPDVRTEHRRGVHGEELGCADCHGGDPTALEVDGAHDPALGYRGTPERTTIPELCATCHADAERMRPFRLPVDQYLEYRSSGHGQRLAEGDERVAVCTDCHGTHAILRPEEPTSPVARPNIAATCARCHADGSLMAAYDLPSDTVERFRKSVHGTSLYEEQHPLAPTCATCHGAHGAIATEIDDIGKVCGFCHARTRDYFEQSPHHAASEAGVMSECDGCHEHHGTQVPDHHLFDTACASCHPAGSPQRATAEKLKTLLARAEESIEAAAAAMATAEAYHPGVAEYHPRLQQARSRYLEALPVQHALALERVEDLTREARSISEEVQATVHGVEQSGQLRYLLLAVIWLFVFFTAAVAHLYKQERVRAREEAGER